MSKAKFRRGGATGYGGYLALPHGSLIFDEFGENATGSLWVKGGNRSTHTCVESEVRRSDLHTGIYSSVLLGKQVFLESDSRLVTDGKVSPRVGEHEMSTYVCPLETGRLL